MATKKGIIRQLLKGASRNDAARLPGCGKATVAKCAAKAREEGIDAEVSAPFEGRRAKRAEEHLEPDCARICGRLARVPKMTLALQRGRHRDCDPGGRRPYRYPRFRKRVGDCAGTHGLAARIAREPGRPMLVDWAGMTAAVRDPVTGKASPAHLFVASFPWSGWVCAERLADMRGRSRISAHVRALRAAGGSPDIIVPDNRATATDRRRKSEPAKVNGAHLETAERYGCAVVPARAGRPRDKAAAEKAVGLCETWALAPMAGERFAGLEEPNAEARRLVGALSARPSARRGGVPRRRVLRRGARGAQPAAAGSLRVVRVAPPQGVAGLPRAARLHAPLGAVPPRRRDPGRAARGALRRGLGRRRDRRRAPSPARPQGPALNGPRPHAARARRGAAPVGTGVVRGARRRGRPGGEGADRRRPGRAPDWGAGLRAVRQHAVPVQEGASRGAGGRVRRD